MYALYGRVMQSLIVQLYWLYNVAFYAVCTHIITNGLYGEKLHIFMIEDRKVDRLSTDQLFKQSRLINKYVHNIKSYFD